MPIYDYVYLNLPKIDTLYSGAVERAEDQIRSTTGVHVTAKGQAKITLGKILQSLGLSPEISGELARKQATSREIVEKLLPAQKLQIVRTALEKEGQLANLNTANRVKIAQLSKQTSFVLIQSNYKLQEFLEQGFATLQEMLKATSPQTLRIVGKLGPFDVQIIMSTASLISPTIFPRFLVLSKSPIGIPLEVFGVLVGLDNSTKLINIDPVAMYYQGKASL